jgi:arylsulfatase
MFGNRAIWADGWKAVTLHGNRMPWNTNVVIPFEDDVWELYHVSEDFSESNNLAETNPEKLEELKQIFHEEAIENNVYPLYDDMIKRLNDVNKVLFGDQKDYVYYAPGAVRIAEKASAPVKGRSHTIETTVNLTGNEEGVIVSCGGMTGGYSMYLKNNKLHFDYNFLDGVHYHLTSGELPVGKTDLKFEFILDKSKLDGTFKPWSGDGIIFVNGEKQDEMYFEAMHISTYSLAETFDVGMDTGTQVDPNYAGSPFEFTGELDRVIVTLTD